MVKYLIGGVKIMDLFPSKFHCMAVLLRKSGQRTVHGTGKADWQEAFSDGTDPPSQPGTREEVGKKFNSSYSRT